MRKNESLILLLLWLYGSIDLVVATFGAGGGGNCPSIEERQALIHHLRVKVIAVAILILKVGAKGAKSLSIGAAYHQSGKVFLPDGADGKSTLGISGGCGISNETLVVKVDDFFLKEDQDDANSAKATVGLDSFHEGKELPVISDKCGCQRHRAGSMCRGICARPPSP